MSTPPPATVLERALRASSTSGLFVLNGITTELLSVGSKGVSYGVEALSPTDCGMSAFKECLKHLRNGHPDEALVHVQRALRSAPKNPFYLPYAGLLAAVRLSQKWGQVQRVTGVLARNGSLEQWIRNWLGG